MSLEATANYKKKNGESDDDENGQDHLVDNSYRSARFRVSYIRQSHDGAMEDAEEADDARCEGSSAVAISRKRAGDAKN